MVYDDRFVDLVRDSVSILNLAGNYVQLKKAGKDYSGLCPFHHEKTPSFTVSEGKQIFKCFGCGAGGDVFKLVMLTENLTFPEAVEYLAGRHGIPLPQRDPAVAEKARRREELLEVMALAAKYFHKKLVYDERSVMTYLTGRGISQETVERFGLGYAPPGRTLLAHFERRKVSLEVARSCGLIKESPDGRLYDNFRNRVVFPIRDLSGKTVAFGGRVLDEGVPKYLNSPETPLYSKGNLLYGLDVTREEIRKADLAVLVEGYFDCVIPYQFGIRNVTATLGTSLTRNQVKLLSRYTRNVVVNFDPDTAGRAAALRSIDLFLEQGFSVSIVQVPQGEDPDSFVRREGGAAYQELLEASMPFVDFAMQLFLSEQKDPSSPKAKQEVINQLLPYLIKLPNRIERAEYASRAATRLHLDPQLVLSELRGRLLGTRSENIQAGSPEKAGSLTLIEENLLRAILDEDLRALVLADIEEEMVETLTTSEIFRQVLRLKKQNQEISVLNLRKALGEGEELQILDRFALSDEGRLPTPDDVRRSIRALQRNFYKLLSLRIQDEIARVETERSSEVRLRELVLKKEHLRRQMELDLTHG